MIDPANNTHTHVERWTANIDFEDGTGLLVTTPTYPEMQEALKILKDIGQVFTVRKATYVETDMYDVTKGMTTYVEMA